MRFVGRTGKAAAQSKETAGRSKEMAARPGKAAAQWLRAEKRCKRGVRRLSACLLLGFLCLSQVLWLTACTGGRSEVRPEDPRTPLDENLIVVGVSQVGSESVWRTANTASLQNTFTKENGYFLIFDNARQKQENQIKAIRSFISQRVDYIVFSPLTEEGWETVLQEAKEAGIPVILIDRKINVEDSSLFTTWIGSDFYNEGRMAGKTLARYLTRQGRNDDTIRIVVLQGTAGATATIGRTWGFREVAEQHENWIILEQADAEFTTAKGQEEMERLLSKYEDIDVVISQNDDMTFGALEAIEQAGKTAGTNGDIMIISFDAVKSALELVAEGVITADIECNPNLGEQVEMVIEKLEKGQPVARLYFVPERVYTKNNAAEAMEGRNY